MKEIIFQCLTQCLLYNKHLQDPEQIKRSWKSINKRENILKDTDTPLSWLYKWMCELFLNAVQWYKNASKRNTPKYCLLFHYFKKSSIVGNLVVLFAMCLHTLLISPHFHCKYFSLLLKNILATWTVPTVTVLPKVLHKLQCSVIWLDCFLPLCVCMCVFN